MEKTAENIAQVRAELAAACKKCGREAESVRLIAVAKFVDTARILVARQNGITDFGENRAQELHQKLNFYELQDCICHYIGQLQSNKVKYVCGNVLYIHSVDRLTLAEEISKRALRLGIVQKVLLQVNIGDEVQKGGVPAAQIRSLLDKVAMLPALSVCGLMGIAPMGTPGESRIYYRALRRLLDALQTEYAELALTECSMGMSGDFAVAIEEGATCVRVGTRIFGNR
ncbi:MAG: YggS family pyridoxal phosphate-dependent enzyme [Clostridiales bacterium]|nr:YggS family pyridoxal phosphate-dependent enzyme [Clostridiales bacterium]